VTVNIYIEYVILSEKEFKELEEAIQERKGLRRKTPLKKRKKDEGDEVG